MVNTIFSKKENLYNLEKHNINSIAARGIMFCHYSIIIVSSLF